MLSTFYLIAFFVVIQIVLTGIWAFLLWIGLRWVGSQKPAPRWILFTAVVTNLFIVVLNCVTLWSSNYGALLAGVLDLLSLILFLVFTWLLIIRLFDVTGKKAFAAMLPTLLTHVVTIVFMVGVVVPHIIEAFAVSSNSMAPTVLGRHWRGVCPTCGETTFCTPSSPDDPYRSPMICKNFHTSENKIDDETVHEPDRLIVTKFLKPRRWDLIVYFYPEQPDTPYLSRLIGLPGETVVIKDGSIYIDGNIAEPPNELMGIEYLSSIPSLPERKLQGTSERPAKLASDEYFVLGDFSAMSNDSRLWLISDDEHHRYAVPETHLIGVATHRYWPPSRWKAFR